MAGYDDRIQQAFSAEEQVNALLDAHQAAVRRASRAIKARQTAMNDSLSEMTKSFHLMSVSPPADRAAQIAVCRNHFDSYTNAANDLAQLMADVTNTNTNTNTDLVNLIAQITDGYAHHIQGYADGNLPIRRR